MICEDDEVDEYDEYEGYDDVCEIPLVSSFQETSKKFAAPEAVITPALAPSTSRPTIFGSTQDANLMTASMVFVHVQKGKAAPVNQIRPETESDRHLFAQGVAAEEMRKIDRANNLQLTAPTQEESEKLHRAMISGLGSAAVPLAATKMEAVELMQPQERNRWEGACSQYWY